MLLRCIRTFGQARHGNVAVAGALLFPFMLLVMAGGLDFALTLRQKSNLQAAADAAALAGAKGLSLADARREDVGEVAAAVVQAVLKANDVEAFGPVSVKTEVRSDPLEVEVLVRQSARVSLGSRIRPDNGEIAIRSVARVVGSPNICVLALDPDMSGAISLEKHANVTGQDCAVFSNSLHNNGIKSKNSATLKASMICSAGGKDGGQGSFLPDPLTDCPTFEDPLAGRPEPTPGPCMAAVSGVVTTSRTLDPGTYCGGLKISGAIEVTLRSGVYVFLDGPFELDGPAKLSGEDVGLFFKGNGSSLKFDRESSISLEAPRTGPMAGMLIFGARDQPESTRYEIFSDDARTLLGTIYVPRGEVYIDANEPIADLSAYTAIVARAMTLMGGPKLVLNTNYHMTSVPVPTGIRGAGQPISLVK